MKISHFSIKHPTIIAMILVALSVFAAYSFTGMPLEFISDINRPSATIVTIYPGASASDVESDVTKILEDDFVTLPNYKSMDSESHNSYSMITVTFNDGVDPYDQLPEIRYRVSQLLDDLPDNIQGEPQVFVGGANMLPVITFTVQGGDDIAQLTSYTENELKPLINHIEGVSTVNVLNGKELEVNVKLRLDDLAAKGISVATVYKALQAGNIKLPIGDGEYQGRTIDVRYEGNYKTLSDIKSLPVGIYNNVIIRVKDVADVSLSYPENEYYVDSPEGSLLVIQITKRSEGNVVDISNELHKILESETARKGNAVTFDIISDDSKTTKVAIQTVLNSGISGLFMAVLVILLFLGDLRATLIIGLSIPISILLTLIEMRVSGMSMNVLAIAGLVVALGMIVDGSIVILEQVYRYYRQRKRSREENILIAADEVGPSIFGSVMTTIVVYVPILMLNGLIGQLLHDISLVLIFALSSSFLIAVAIVTFLMNKILKPVPRLPRKRLFNTIMNSIEKGYKVALNWCINTHRYVILLSILIFSFSLYIITALGFTFLPSVDTGEFDIYMKYPQGYSLEKTREKTLKAMELVSAAIPEAKSIVIYSGDNGDFSGQHPANYAHINVVLNDVSERDRKVQEIILETQKLLSSKVVDCTTTVTNGGIDKLIGYVSGGGGYGITLVSEDLDLLYSEAKRIEAEIQTDPSVVTTSLNTDFDSSTLIIDMSHDFLNSVGVNSYEAGITSIILFNGLEAGIYHADNGEQYTIKLESNMKDEPITPDTIAKMHIISAAGKEISFASLSDIQIEKAVSTINHSDRAKQITINAKLVNEDTAPITFHINKYLKENPLADGVTSKPGGILQLISDSLPPMISAILIAIFLVFTVMVFQFENFRQPIIVMATVPFCIIGVVLGLLTFGSTMSIVSVLGLLSLAGIVVNNGIILIDYFNQKRELENDNEDNLRKIVISGSASRLRPILMTTLSTMFGVMPMAVAKGIGSELYAPLGQSIAGGLITSTLISLFVIPIIYYIVEVKVIHKKIQKGILKEDGSRVEIRIEDQLKQVDKQATMSKQKLRELLKASRTQSRVIKNVSTLINQNNNQPNDNEEEKKI
ncbi:MAG: efflux RND transporter permease subunit [Spirochaetia bacterium]|nr:efflux RND transporter permease subunit [Spirochaetia bacterium]